MVCPHCKLQEISVWGRFFSNPSSPVICPRCTGVSLPGASRGASIAIRMAAIVFFGFMFVAPAFVTGRTWVIGFCLAAPATFVVLAYYQLHGPLVSVSGAELRRTRRIGWALSASLLLGLILIGAI